jgi:hypothetical protein
MGRAFNGTRSGVTVAQFACEDDSATVHYSLLCDFRRDCADGSDETFCAHGARCSGFTCRNGQCLSRARDCDSVPDCWDGSDEECEPVFLLSAVTRLPPPTRIDFLGK